MKKLLALLLTLVLLATALVGCGNKNNPPYNDPDQPLSGANGDSTTDGNETVGGDGTTEGDETTDGNEATYSEGLVFTLSEDQSSYMLSGVGTCRDSEIIIPATYENRPVTVIKSYTFENCDWLTKVTIPNSIVEIEGSAFYNCPQLDKLIIPESVTKLDGGSIQNCPNAVEVQDSVTYVDKWLVGCDQTVASVAIRNNTVGIADYAFNGCSQITDIVIPNSVKYLGDSFEECTSLKNVTLSNSITKIEGRTFYFCTALETITIPDGVTTIGDGAFMDCSSLKTITLPEGLTTIGAEAFSKCYSLESIDMPDSVTFLGAWAFYNCIGLKNVKLSNGLKNIAEETFGCCPVLKTIYFTGTLTDWDNLEKEDTWDRDISGCTIKCTDGDITIN